ncbi:MAG: hypothetical protein M1829_006534 [Trizodia sp. TS-e1964]|nr:MAG: hypothetical protein M1829_006534 [Trizodia sp. TS-e1964]
MSTTENPKSENDASHSSRNYVTSKRYGGDSSSHGRSNPFSNITPITANSVASPTSGASSAFGLGSGAFASFGSSIKTPKPSGNTNDLANSSSSSTFQQPLLEKREKDNRSEQKSETIRSATSSNSLNTSPQPTLTEHPLKYTWVVWYRPPTSKYSDYEKSTIAVASFSTIEAFCSVYAHLKRPSSLPSVSDYHIFKKGVRPVWEDKENRKGGKWILRLKKGVADRYWEELLLAIVGDQFAEAGEEVCGAVLSVRSGEDVLSVWTRIDGGRNIKIRETIKRLLALPSDTNIVWKSHDDSIAQRSAIDEIRQQKGTNPTNHHSDQRHRINTSGDFTSERHKASPL